ncbi:MAG: UDP-N-acetylglucosamine 2-epimerase [Candidatus Aenigmatarchaeota archaeon]
MRKIAFITERRADYSRFKPILDLIKKDTELDYTLVVTGAHLMKKYGHTIDVIKKDGFKVAAEIPIFDEDFDDTGAEMVRGIGRILVDLPTILEKEKPDIVLAGFDLGPNLAIAITGSHMNIPVFHLQGGEVTGSIDESLRHATTKFAHVHLASNDDAVKRLIRMGENPKYVFNVGCTSLDVIRNAKKISKETITKRYGLDPSRPYVIIIQHPITTEVEKATRQILETIKAVKSLGVQSLFIYPNTDAGNKKILKEIENSTIKYVPFLDLEDYANLLKYSSALVGNSSSGIHETCFLHVPTVNIGSRQQGRLRPENVIDVDHNKEKIKSAIKKALYNEKFLAKVRRCKSPYGDGRSAQRVIKVLKSVKITPELIQKKITY